MRMTITVGLLLALSACNKNDSRTSETRDEDSVGVDTRTESAKPAADNTDRNERDRADTALTPGDQGESEADRGITQQVRQSVMKEDGLSMNAKNVKIITNNGTVTLRGPVESANEKASIGRLAQSATGVKQVDNQLEIVSP